MRRELTPQEERYLMLRIRGVKIRDAAEEVGLSYREAVNLQKRSTYKEELLRLTATTVGRAEVTLQSVTDEMARVAFFPLEEDPIVPPAVKLRALELLGKSKNVRMFTEEIEVKDTTDRPGATRVDIEERIKALETERDPSLIAAD
jgi:hypothetical protein